MPLTTTHAGPLTRDERDLLTHISRFGSDGYPVGKVGSMWRWSYRDTHSERAYTSKKQATQNFEQYLETLRRRDGEAAYTAAIAAQNERILGWLNAELKTAGGVAPFTATVEHEFLYLFDKNGKSFRISVERID
jgi:hypothetical protein